MDSSPTCYIDMFGLNEALIFSILQFSLQEKETENSLLYLLSFFPVFDFSLKYSDKSVRFCQSFSAFLTFGHF